MNASTHRFRRAAVDGPMRCAGTLALAALIAVFVGFGEPTAARTDPASAEAAAGLGQGAVTADVEWIRRQPAQNYTLQVLASTDEAAALDYLRRVGFRGPVAVFRVRSGDKTWVKAVYNSFASRSEALLAGAQLVGSHPGAVEPWPRRFFAVVSEIEAAEGESPASTDPEVQGPARITAAAAADLLRRAQAAFNRQDYHTAQIIWKTLAEQGEMEAEYGLGFLYESGWGVERDYAEAFRWYKRAAEKGHVKAQYNLGILYMHGRGTGVDRSRGRYWIEASARQDDRRAVEYMRRIGGMH